jgi:hypothetical protein
MYTKYFEKYIGWEVEDMEKDFQKTIPWAYMDFDGGGGIYFLIGNMNFGRVTVNTGLRINDSCPEDKELLEKDPSE